jgi:hypothetical protein
MNRGWASSPSRETSTGDGNTRVLQRPLFNATHFAPDRCPLPKKVNGPRNTLINVTLITNPADGPIQIAHICRHHSHHASNRSAVHVHLAAYR